MEIDYEVEELLPIVGWLSDKYTSKESSSVPYETANMLMEAVLYTIREGADVTEEALIHEKPAAILLFEQGQVRIREKCLEAKKIYEEMALDFEDYGCKNYRDTFFAIPKFFQRYDTMFSPQDHLLMLDYPTLGKPGDSRGIDLILFWLSGIRMERRFLDCFPRETVREVLERQQPGYEELFLGNICEAVLFQALACFLTDCPMENMCLEQQDCAVLKSRFHDKSPSQARQICEKGIGLMVSGGIGSGTASYLAGAGEDFGSRICLGIETGSLENMFCNIKNSMD